jgi:hypothetical protein
MKPFLMKTLPTNSHIPKHYHRAYLTSSSQFRFVETDEDFLIGMKKFLAIAENNHTILFNNDSQGKDQKNFDHFQRRNQTMTYLNDYTFSRKYKVQ